MLFIFAFFLCVKNDRLFKTLVFQRERLMNDWSILCGHPRKGVKFGQNKEFKQIPFPELWKNRCQKDHPIQAEKNCNFPPIFRTNFYLQIQWNENNREKWHQTKSKREIALKVVVIMLHFFPDMQQKYKLGNLTQVNRAL